MDEPILVTGGTGTVGRDVVAGSGPPWTLQRSTTDLAPTWLAARRIRRPVLHVRVPGRIAGAYRAGGHLTPEHAEGRVTFAAYLVARTLAGQYGSAA